MASNLYRKIKVVGIKLVKTSLLALGQMFPLQCLTLYGLDDLVLFSWLQVMFH